VIGAVGQREHLVGAGRCVVDGINHHLQVDRNAGTAGAVLRDELNGRELAVVVGRPSARVDVNRVAVDLAEQRRVAASHGAIRQRHDHLGDV